MKGKSIETKGDIQTALPAAKTPKREERPFFGVFAAHAVCVVRNWALLRIYVGPLSRRDVVQPSLEQHCAFRPWVVLALNARASHAHTVLSADEEIGRVLKALNWRAMSPPTTPFGTPAAACMYGTRSAGWVSSLRPRGAGLIAGAILYEMGQRRPGLSYL